MITNELTRISCGATALRAKKRETMNIGGQEYPIIGYIENETCGIVPLVDIPMISDEKWNRLAEVNMKAYREI